MTLSSKALNYHSCHVIIDEECEHYVPNMAMVAHNHEVIEQEVVWAAQVCAAVVLQLVCVCVSKSWVKG